MRRQPFTSADTRRRRVGRVPGDGSGELDDDQHEPGDGEQQVALGQSDRPVRLEDRSVHQSATAEQQQRSRHKDNADPPRSAHDPIAAP